MASITDVIVLTTTTNILTAAASRLLSGPLHVKNESAEIVTLIVAGSDPIALDPGQPQHVLPGQLVTGTSPSGTALVQVYSGIVPTDESAAKAGGGVVAAGSVSAGDGRGRWSVGQNDFTAAFLDVDSLTLGTFPTAMGTPVSGDFSVVIVTPLTGVQRAYVPTANKMTLAGQVLTVTGAKFAADDVGYDVICWGPPRGYDAAINGDQIQRLNPEWAHIGSNQQNASSLPDGTTYKYWDVETYHNWANRILDTPGATGSNLYTLETSTLNDDTAEGAADYQDRTQELLGQASFSSAQLAADPSLAVWQLCCFDLKYIRIKSVRSGDGGSTDGAYQYDAMWS